MKNLHLLTLTGLTLASASCDTSTAVERIELRRSGAWSSVEVLVNSAGKGHYKSFVVSSVPQNGTFSISPAEYKQLVSGLKPFQRQSLVYTDASARKLEEQGCPLGVPYVTDRGALWIHWIGPDTNTHYLADFECDPAKNAIRNKRLLKIFESLPIPQPTSPRA